MTSPARPSSRPEGAAPGAPRARRPARTVAGLVFAVLALLAFAGFVALGIWQVERRAWKLDLIERVTQRVQAAPVDPPPVADGARLDASRDEYRRLRLSGVFLHDRETLVQATTEIGGGFWVITPLRLADGSHVLVNRGFVTPDRRDRAARGETASPPGNAGDAGGVVVVTGLLRLSEPGGAFLRDNDPVAGRWHSRDVAAIAAARGLQGVAPYFVDAEASAAERAQPALLADSQRRWPVAGLTVIQFNNHHLVYAITWFALALMAALAAAYLLREVWRARSTSPDGRAG